MARKPCVSPLTMLGYLCTRPASVRRCAQASGLYGDRARRCLSEVAILSSVGGEAAAGAVVLGGAVREGASIRTLPVGAEDLAFRVDESSLWSSRDVALNAVPQLGAGALEDAVRVAPKARGTDGSRGSVADTLRSRLGGGGVTGRLVRWGWGAKPLARGWGPRGPASSDGIASL